MQRPFSALLSATERLTLTTPRNKSGLPYSIARMGLVLPEPEPLEHTEERGLFYVAIIRAKHQSYILYDTEKPSVFIKEESVNQDRKYQFNQISTEGVKSAPPDYATCPSCGSGKVAMS